MPVSPANEAALRFLNSPAAFLSAVMVGIFAFGIGLTSPIWFVAGGMGPIAALNAGTPIVTCTIVGLIVTTVVGIVAYRLKKGDAAEPAETYEDAPPSRWKTTIVHVLVMLMFIIPFLTIILGMLLTKFVDFDAG